MTRPVPAVKHSALARATFNVVPLQPSLMRLHQWSSTSGRLCSRLNGFTLIDGWLRPQRCRAPRALQPRVPW